jgi:ABC-2 type transport system permease protein
MYNLVAFNTILRKEVNRFLRIWTQTLLPPVITQSLYFVVFGTFIGGRIVEQGNEFGGQSYIGFIIPGLVMMAVITSSFSNVVSSFFGSKFQRNIEELLVSPTANWIIIAGYVMGGVIRGLLVGGIVYAVSFVFVRPEIQNPLLVILFVTLTAVVFSLGGFTNAVFAKKFDDVQIFPTFVLTPLTYLGGVFYSVSQLPEFWQNVSRLNPVLYMINGFRYGFYGAGASDVSLTVSISMLVVFTLILGGLNYWLLKRGIGLRS